MGNKKSSGWNYDIKVVRKFEEYPNILLCINEHGAIFLCINVYYPIRNDFYICRTIPDTELNSMYRGEIDLRTVFSDRNICGWKFTKPSVYKDCYHLESVNEGGNLSFFNRVGHRVILLDKYLHA